MIFTLNSARDNTEKALQVLTQRARNAGYDSFGDLVREVEPEAENGKIYKFSLEAA